MATPPSPLPPAPILPDLTSGQRNFITTDRDHGGIALTVCTLMATWVVLCLIIRIYVRATVSGPFGVDDVVCIIATICGIVQMIVSSVAVSFGFGKYLELLSGPQIEKASKAIYVAQLLYVVTNALTKCTVALLMARLVFAYNRVHACYMLVVASCLWGIGSFIAQAVRCAQHAPWRIVGVAQCSDRYLSWQVITAFNILLECALLAFPVWLVCGLRTPLSKKLTVIAVFWLRLPVIVAAGVRLHFLHKTIGSGEPLFNAVIPFTLLNIEMHYGLMAATMPTLKPFVSAFNTAWGTLNTQSITDLGQSCPTSSHALQSLGIRSDRKWYTPMITKTPTSSKIQDQETGLRKYGKNVTHVRSTRLTEPFRMHSGGSSSSKQMLIHQTVETEIHLEDYTWRQNSAASSKASSAYSHQKIS